jgi:hypothetical protein
MAVQAAAVNIPAWQPLANAHLTVLRLGKTLHFELIELVHAEIYLLYPCRKFPPRGGKQLYSQQSAGANRLAFKVSFKYIGASVCSALALSHRSSSSSLYVCSSLLSRPVAIYTSVRATAGGNTGIKGLETVLGRNLEQFF